MRSAIDGEAGGVTGFAAGSGAAGVSSTVVSATVALEGAEAAVLDSAATGIDSASAPWSVMSPRAGRSGLVDSAGACVSEGLSDDIDFSPSGEAKA